MAAIPPADYLRDSDEVIAALQREVFEGQSEFRHYRDTAHARDMRGLHDFEFAAENDPHLPDDVFPLLRWGGQFVYASRYADRLFDSAGEFARRGFDIVRGPAWIRRRVMGMRLPFLGQKIHYFAARKVLLTRPREFSDRFTYHLRLVEDKSTPEGYAVVKEVPTTQRVSARLRQRFANLSSDVLIKRAQKFTQKIFPIFLTREAAMLKILERDLPPQFADRVPRLLDLEKDERGYVRKLKMRWLRNAVPGHHPLTQLEFAIQSAQMLQALHETARVIHLDLRLDNFVITEKGVGFVDFGSAVRVGEDLNSNALVSALFEELMRTSEIQRMLERMTLSGSVTSPAINEGFQRVDKAVDFFYLAVQINSPLSNPDFLGLVQYDAESDEAKAIKKLTDEVLRPKDLNHPPYRTAGDLLEGLRKIEKVTMPASTSSQSLGPNPPAEYQGREKN